MTTIAEAVYIYRSDAKPLGAVDSWRLANLLRNGAGKAELVRVRPHALQRAEILLRRGSSDAGIAVQTLVHGLHVPPTPSRAPEVVWDLGANIGLTVAHYACLYPAARIVGVEPDPENAALAVRNIDSWRGRCRIIQCAVCAEDGEVGFELDPGHELAGRVVELEEGSPRHRRVRACSLTTLLRDEIRVDLLKVDIEGAEREVLRQNTSWAAKVQRIIVEVHEPYTVEECMEDLRRLGFSPIVNPKFWVSIVGTRSA